MIEEFRAELTKWVENLDFRPKQWRTYEKLKGWRMGNKFVFYGERGTVDGTFPVPSESRAKSRWKNPRKTKQGQEAVRIEECAKRGPFAEVQGGLMNGK